MRTHPFACPRQLMICWLVQGPGAVGGETGNRGSTTRVFADKACNDHPQVESLPPPIPLVECTFHGPILSYSVIVEWNEGWSNGLTNEACACQPSRREKCVEWQVRGGSTCK